MRLSEAIRLGAMLRPQAFRTWFDAQTGGSCALGAAGEAVGVAVFPRCRFVAGKHAPQAWAWIRRVDLCPVCGYRSEIQDHVRHLNNEHRWTRERIADWIAAFESPEQLALPREAVAVSGTPEGSQ